MGRGYERAMVIQEFFHFFVAKAASWFCRQCKKVKYAGSVNEGIPVLCLGSLVMLRW